jgi:hypothetical protein
MNVHEEAREAVHKLLMHDPRFHEVGYSQFLIWAVKTAAAEGREREAVTGLRRALERVEWQYDADSFGELLNRYRDILRDHTQHAAPAVARSEGLDVDALAKTLVEAGRPTNLLTEAGWRVVLPGVLAALRAAEPGEPGVTYEKETGPAGEPVWRRIEAPRSDEGLQAAATALDHFLEHEARTTESGPPDHNTVWPPEDATRLDDLHDALRAALARTDPELGLPDCTLCKLGDHILPDPRFPLTQENHIHVMCGDEIDRTSRRRR